MDKYICECCGGHINPRTMKCEYCGTQYKKEYDNYVRIETFQNPVITLKSRVMLDRDVPLEVASRYALEELTRELARNLTPFLVTESMYHPDTMLTEVNGMIKIVKPEKIGV